MLRRLIVFFALATLSAPAFAQDAADAIVRLNRLENQFRQMSGQVEQLQYENRQLKEQLRKFQEDVEFRFQENRGGSKPAPSTTTPTRPGQPPAQPQRRGDAYEPGAVAEAPGAPLPLGTTPPSTPLASTEAPGPMALPGGQLAGIGDLIEQDEAAPPGSRPLDLSQAGHAAAPLPATSPATAPAATPPSRQGPSVAAASSGDPRSEYETAYSYLTQRQYEQAEMGFRRFLQSNPRDKLVPDATFWLGESYFQRGRHREAAEQFLNVSADHPNAAKAPEALLKLGVTLNAIGAKDRACAVFTELDRKYPQAPASVREGSAREQKRVKCS
ncbi:tol-pal system protein YbgF [Microvirga flavescens]|uniref:tol-pal system protein YbgF n=1 Tax=Microvirga flavescens TaxID=2249811 RepID=UPI000DD97125|nr:tol-pal system protein YbgF [Microvirga flavescens]